MYNHLFFIMRKLIYLLFFLSFQVSAQVSINKEYSSTAVNFLNIIQDAQSFSLGGGVATSPAISNICQNISKSVFLDKKIAFSFSYHPWMRNIIEDMNFTHLFSVYKIDKYSSLLLSYTHLNLGEFDKFSNSKGFVGSNIGYESFLNLSYARKIAYSTSLGISFKYISSNIDSDIKTSGLAVDLSCYNTNTIFNGKLNIGFVISNIGGKMKFSNDKYFLPMTSKIALTYEYLIGSNHKLSLNSQLSKLMVANENKYFSNSNSENLLVGIQKDETVLESFMKSINEKTLTSISVSSEYIYKSTFSGRCGLKYYNTTDKMILFGIGLEKYRLIIDLAYSFYINSEMQLNDNVFLTFSFNI